MRRIGQIDAKGDAERFANHLMAFGITSDITKQPDGVFSIWVHEEKHLDRSRQELLRYLDNPTSSEYSKTIEAGQQLKSTLKAEEKAAKRVEKQVQRKLRPSSPRLTVTLIVLCLLVAVISSVGSNREAMTFLFISEYISPVLPEVRQGQVWRLFSPMLMHFGVLHIVFNLLWLWDLGRRIEWRKGSFYFAAMVLTISMFSNLAQYFYTGPVFGGMSGVVYGLLGFLWIKGRFDPMDQLGVPDRTMYIMLGWLFLCMTGLLGPVANTAHVVGLLMGGFWAMALIFLNRLRG
jgi:GlpG protein